MNDNYFATAKLERNVNKFSQILNWFTPLYKIKETWLDRQPWLRGDREYGNTLRIKRAANKLLVAAPNEINKANYKEACRNNFSS